MSKLDIFMCVPGLPFDGETIKRGSLGGSETAGYYMARELARIGHRVTMFCGTEKESYTDGVRYIPLDNFAQASRVIPHDVCIVQRAPQAFSSPKASKLNVLWQHDLAVKQGEQDFRGSLWNIDVVMLLSKFHMEQYADIFNVREPTAWQTRNGIDLKAFQNVAAVPRNKKRLFFAARPERGLDNLLDKIMTKLRSVDPEITLAVAGYENNVDHMAEFYSHCAELVNRLGPNVVHLGALNKAQLYQELAASALYVYPTPSEINAKFAEISCILAMEAQACGTPIVASNKGALAETVKGGVLIDGDPWTDEYIDKFCAEVLDLLSNQERWSGLSAIGRMHAGTLDWSHVAREWSDEFERRIRDNNITAERLAMHLVRESDVDALDHLLKVGVFKDETFPRELSSYVDAMYGFRSSPEAFSEHYRVNGEATSKALATHPIEAFAGQFTNNPEPRFGYIEQFLKSKGVKTVLDYGCGHGWMSIYMHNRTGIKVCGVDVDPGAIEWSEKFKQFASDPAALTFGTELPPVPTSDEDKFDCLIVSEVLEHVIDPIGLMTTLEKYIKVGGHVLFTVPYGPAELGTPHWQNFRNHIREWNTHDLDDIFGNRKSFAVGAVFSHFNDLTNEPVGCWVGVYQIAGDEAALGSIDMDRHMWLQRPRQSVSLNVMAGSGSGETIRWMLNSTRDIVDEVVIADTGMGDLDKIATNGFNVKFVEAPDPKIHGFETPRNMALEHCTMDWVMWLDTDEKLTDGKNLLKYLRNNCFSGYGIRQHHFAVDTTFTPDMPVRLFRREPVNGKKLRWIGMIHEHPETGVNEGPGEVIIISDVNIAHTGYLAESGRRGRFARNLPLLMKDAEKYPDRILQKHFIMRDKVQLASHHLQGNGGRMTAEIKQHLRDVVELYRKHFLGKQIYTAIDSTHWYSEALRMLGEGFEVSSSLDVAARDVKPTAHRVCRYANKDDFMKDFAARVESQLSPFDQRYM